MFQSGGYGTSADLALSIEYGASNGAQILNYSGGGYGESFVVAIAIADAYAGSGSGDGSILIAAAGNDYFKVDKPFPPFPPYAPMFPGCYNYVVGVEATQQNGIWLGFQILIQLVQSLQMMDIFGTITTIITKLKLLE